MKSTPKKIHQQRQILDLRKVKIVPANGWVKTVRTALGISSKQLALLMGENNNTVPQLESNEISKTISLQRLSRAAEAMDCELFYMIKPKKEYKSFDDILEKKSLALAEKISLGVAHSMNLEQQIVDKKITLSQIKSLAQDLKKKIDSRMWTLPAKIKK